MEDQGPMASNEFAEDPNMASQAAKNPEYHPPALARRLGSLNFLRISTAC